MYIAQGSQTQTTSRAEWGLKHELEGRTMINSTLKLIPPSTSETRCFNLLTHSVSLIEKRFCICGLSNKSKFVLGHGPRISYFLRLVQLSDNSKLLAKLFVAANWSWHNCLLNQHNSLSGSPSRVLCAPGTLPHDLILRPKHFPSGHVIQTWAIPASVVHGSIFLDPTRSDPEKCWPDPTRDCRQKVWPDPSLRPFPL